MKKKLFLPIVTLLGSLCLAFSAGAAPPLSGWFEENLVAEEREAPETGFTTIVDGGERAVTLTDYRGKVLLVNFWATWCAPCIEEMPDLDSLQAELGGSDFEVLAISNDRKGLEQVEPFYRQQDLGNLGIWLDPKGELAQELGVRGLPTSFVIDRQGRIIGRAEGAAPWAGEEAVALIQWYMER